MPFERGDKVVDRSGFKGTVVGVTDHRGSRWYDVRFERGVAVRYDYDLMFDPDQLAIAKRNGAIVDLQRGEFVRDGEGEIAEFLSYGDNAPLYVNLLYSGGLRARLPNAELRRCQ